MTAHTWLVLAEVGCSSPEVFGTFFNHEDAHAFANVVRVDPRVEYACVVAAIPPEEFWNGEYWS